MGPLWPERGAGVGIGGQADVGAEWGCGINF